MPFTDRFTRVDGRLVGYVDEGPRDGIPVLLLHGGGFDHAELTWKITVRDLRDRLRLIVPDLPGYGESEGFGRSHDLGVLGRWLVAFLDALGLERVDVAGVSMGGGAALWLALEHPARVRRLVPVGSYGIMSKVPLHSLAVMLAQTGLSVLVYRAAGSSRLLARTGLMATYGARANVTEEAVDDLMAVARDQGRRRSFDAFLEGELARGGLKSDLTPRLAEIAAPTLFIHGIHDRIVPVRHARKAARTISGADLLELPTGHWPMRERPDLFNPALLDFLRR